MAQQQQHSQDSNSSFLLDSLYCSEEQLEGQEEELQPMTSSSEIISQHDINNDQDHYLESLTTSSYVTIVDAHRPNPSRPILLEQDLAWEEDDLVSLLSKEKANQLFSALRNDPSLALAEARGGAVAWVLKVVAHYSFSALTATLAVDYLDRFLSSFPLQPEKPWTTQLAAVACLSLAAKVETQEVPLLLDFQVEESEYLFEAKMIYKMELLVLSTLEWKMNPVTPISFLDYIIRRLGLKDHLSWEFLKRCETIVVSLIADSRSMSFLPSIIATATMLYVVDSIEPCLQAQYQNQLLGILGIDKEKAEDCCKLIFEIASASQSRKRKYYLAGSVPSSPNGVIDVSFSSDSSNDSWSVSSSPETLSKKIRAQTTTDSDFLSIVRR